MAERDLRNDVGPVLEAGENGRAVIRAIRKLNSNVSLLDRGSYVRVLVPRRCTVTRAAVEAELGRPFQFPGDLEQLMPSFQGTLSMSSEEASWTWKEDA